MPRIFSCVVLNFSLYTKLNFTLIYIKNIKELNFECLKFYCFAALAFSFVGITFPNFFRKTARSREKNTPQFNCTLRRFKNKEGQMSFTQNRKQGTQRWGIFLEMTEHPTNLTKTLFSRRRDLPSSSH